MLRNKIFIALSFFVIFIIGVIFAARKLTTNKDLYLSVTPIPSQVQEELQTWTDPAEFSFNFPKSLAVDPHDEDQENYAHVELTSDTHPGNLIVWVKDASVDSLEDWLKESKYAQAIDSTLADRQAKKILSDGTTQKLMLVTLREGYLYQIEVTLVDQQYWNTIYDLVVNSFQFVSSDEDDSSSKDTETILQTSDEAIYEEEELIE